VALAATLQGPFVCLLRKAYLSNFDSTDLMKHQEPVGLVFTHALRPKSPGGMRIANNGNTVAPQAAYRVALAFHKSNIYEETLGQSTA
jgi:hypothetical protein